MSSINCNGTIINTVSGEEVVELHKLLSTHKDLKVLLPEPIQPPGIKNVSNLDMAVSRQSTGSGQYYKYDNRYLNCATLLFGVTKGHIFHNGNKRTAFLCMLKHLYKNGLVLKAHSKQNDIYVMLKKLASTEEDFRKYASQGVYRKYYRNICAKFGYETWSTDAIVCFLERWLMTNTISKTKVHCKLKWNNLFIKLEQFGLEYKIENKGHSSTITIERKKKVGLFKLVSKSLKVVYPYRGETCSPRQIKQIRNDFNLTKHYGIENAVFYSENIFIDEELATYRKLIYKLSLT